MDTQWRDLPLDTVSNILSFNTQLPTYSHLSKELNVRGRANLLPLFKRIDQEYPYWDKLISYDMDGLYDTRFLFHWHIQFYMNLAALDADWEAFKVIARVWSRNMELTEWAIIGARINGRPDLARNIYENSIQKGSYSYIDVYYQSDSWTEKQIRKYLDRIRVGPYEPADIEIGWVSDKMRSVATKMATTRGSFMNPKTEPQSEATEIALRLLYRPYNRVRSESDLWTLAPSVWGGMNDSYPEIYNAMMNHPHLTYNELMNVIVETNVEKAWQHLPKNAWEGPYNKGNIEIMKQMHKIINYVRLPPILRVYMPRPSGHAQDDIVEQFVSSFRDGTPFPELPLTV